MKCEICNKEITEYGCPDCNPEKYLNNIARDIESQNLSKEELEDMDYGCICCGLEKALALSMKKNNPGSVIIKDEGNPGCFTLMGYKSGTWQEKIPFLGYMMTEQEKQFLLDDLTEDILKRYNNIEYYNQAIIKEFAKLRGLKGVKND